MPHAFIVYQEHTFAVARVAQLTPRSMNHGWVFDRY